MRPITPAATKAAGQVVRPIIEVTSWLGATMLGTIPVLSGRATLDLTIVGGALDLQVPRAPEWIPRDPRHPLAAYGQELLVRRGWADAQGTPQEWATIGRFMISRAKPSGQTVTVRADGIGQRIVNDKLAYPLTVKGSQLAQARALLQGTGIPVRLEGIPDGSRGTRTWERGASRADAWAELVSAWGAVSYVDGPSRSMVIRGEWSSSGTPAVTIRDGEGGCLVELSAGDGDEDGRPNAVVASTAPEDGSVPVSAVATIGTGPRRWHGPYGRRPAFFASPLLKTRAQVERAARTRLQTLQARTWDLTVSALSCPAIEPGDLVRVISAREDTDVVARVVSSTVALTPTAEPGGLSLIALSGRLGGMTL